MRCFVIQPFDGDKFDRRYKDSFAPAIKKAGLEPYRVDSDLSGDILIDEIERGIKESDACLADITEDNPNVWFELGFALASRIPCCIVCSKERSTKYPFDIQHRRVIQYDTESKGDYVALEESIRKRLEAMIKSKKSQEEMVRSSTASSSAGLGSCEVAVLGFLLAAEIEVPSVPGYRLLRDMEETSFTKTRIGLAVSNLLNLKYIEIRIDADYNGNEANLYCVTDMGREWLRENPEGLPPFNPPTVKEEPIPEDDIPF
jgi:nucleoside 2-deoxyribosyltransferase